MRIIDPHVHVWKRDPLLPFAPETRTPPEEDALPEELLGQMAAHGVEGTVLVQVIYYRWDNRYTASVLHRYPDKFMAVCRVNPEDPVAPDHLSYWTQEQGFQGVRLSPASDASGDWIRGPLMAPLWRRAAELGVPMCILTRPDRLGDVAQLCEKHPDLDVVIDHMADPELGRDEELPRLLALARYPRVYVKISHTWSISREGFPWRDTHGLVERVYRAFGAPRLMWGTDWPMSQRLATYEQTLAVVREELPFFAPEEREWVLGKTALKLWPFGKQPKSSGGEGNGTGADR